MEAANKGANRGGKSRKLNISLPLRNSTINIDQIRKLISIFFLSKVMFVKYAQGFAVLQVLEHDELFEATTLIQTSK